MSILSSIGRIAAEYSAARARHRTERALRSLPAELREDIGWPDLADRRFGTTNWSAARQSTASKKIAGHVGAADGRTSSGCANRKTPDNQENQP